MIKGLFTTITNVSFNPETITALIDEVHAEKQRLVPNCVSCAEPCGRNDDYDMEKLWNADEDIRSLKSLILFGIRGMAAYAWHANVLSYRSEEVNTFFARALFAIGEVYVFDKVDVADEIALFVIFGDLIVGRASEGGKGAVHRHLRP